MLNKLRKDNNYNSVNIYKKSLDLTDITNCYFDVLNQVKGYYYSVPQFNYIDMYSDISSLEYENSIYNNKI